MRRHVNTALDRLRHSLPPWATILLMVPPLLLVAFVAQAPVISIADGSLPRFVLSGRFLTERFTIVHVGWDIDQFTIGKWLLRSTVLTLLTIPYMVFVRWISNRSTSFGYWSFAAASVALSFMLLSTLSWPAVWLVYHIHSLGVTTRRIAGLAYGAISAITILGFLYWTSGRRKPAKSENQAE